MYNTIVGGGLLNSQPFDPEDPKLALMMALIVSIVATLSAVSSLSVFGSNQVMFRREKDYGMSVSAFVLSKCLIDLVENIWQPIFFLGWCYNWILPKMRFMNFAVIVMLDSFAGSGIGMLTSVAVAPGSMTIVAVLLTLVIGIFMNGTIGIYYEDVKSNDLLLAAWTCSYSRWVAEMLVIYELQANNEETYQEVLVQDTAKFYGYFPRILTQAEFEEQHPTMADQQETWDDYIKYLPWTALNIILIGVSLRLLTYGLMYPIPLIVDSLRVHYNDAVNRAANYCFERLEDVAAAGHVVGNNMRAARTSIFGRGSIFGRDDDDLSAEREDEAVASKEDQVGEDAVDSRSGRRRGSTLRMKFGMAKKRQSRLSANSVSLMRTSLTDIDDRAGDEPM
eukprot:gene24538-29849_t